MDGRSCRGGGMLPARSRQPTAEGCEVHLTGDYCCTRYREYARAYVWRLGGRATAEELA